ncbi:hypothetical protein PG994_014389 [Apiospora phragmitis]|uniref:EF-hand superfamily Ca2+-modulated protein n=1 Tax=Apiospora phragmitis TaxID=2905665 RepID=A0ABR1T480_9PEZI
MPAKRKASALAASSAAAPKERQSKLAKEHSITAREEAEIKEAFALFSEPMDGEKEGVIPTSDVRRAMVYTDGLTTEHQQRPEPHPHQTRTSRIPLHPRPRRRGLRPYEPFVAICALKLHARDDDTDETHAAEVDEAFRLFVGNPPRTNAGGEEEVPPPTLTLGHLKRVAMTLKQDVDDQLLKDMILEANGGAGVGRGVGRAEFEEVMRRAGVWK